jgi:methylenetetrahydrofolate reductase (NADPH)
MVGVKRLGYAGVHLTGVSSYEEHSALLDLATALDRELQAPDAWSLAWQRAHTLRDGRVATLAPPDGVYLFPHGAPPPGSLTAPPDPGRARAAAAELRTYRGLAALDRALFRPGSAGAAILGPLMRTVDRTPPGRRALLALERAVKTPLLGCRMCGSCRLPYTFFVCPETCPKGLANGACAGSDDNRCEFGDRECTHNRAYRIAKATGRLSDLETLLIPAVTGTGGTCSWVNHYRGAMPLPAKLQAGSGFTP